MFFKDKFERVIKMNRELDQELKDELQRNPLEKNDVLAMIIAALLVLLPAILLVFGIFLLVIWLFI